MGFLELFGKKKQSIQFSLPPLPSPPQFESGSLASHISSDIEPVQAGQTIEVSEPKKPFLLEPIQFEKEETKPRDSFQSVHQSFQETPEQIRAQPRAMFISTTDYKQIFSGANIIRTKLEQAEHIMNQLTTLKNQQEHFFEQWRVQLEDTEKKITYIDMVLDKATRS